MTTPRVGVIGATGMVGRELLALIADRGLLSWDVRAFASERSAGAKVPFGDGALEVEATTEQAFEDLDVALLCAGSEVSRRFGRAAASRGCIVIDNSSAFRMDPDVPLVIPEVNGAALDEHENLIANPNCTTIVNAMVAAPLHRAFGLRRMIVASYQAASGAGAGGLSELIDGVRGHLDGAEPQPTVFAAPLPFNVVPLIGVEGEDAVTGEERKMGDESRKILDAPELEVVCTCVRVPVARAHGVATTAWLRSAVEVESLRAALRAAPGIELADLPTPRSVSGRDLVEVGRLRVADFDGHVVSWFAVGDQVRKGAALNAVQIAERVVQAAP